jgi:hypothetical protein
MCEGSVLLARSAPTPPHAIAAQHLTHALIGLHLGQCLIEQLDLKPSLFEQPFDLPFGNGGDVVKPHLAQRLDLIAL